MPTGDRRINLTDKHLLGKVELRDRFLDYLEALTRNGDKQIFNRTGSITVPIDIDISQADEITLTPNGAYASDGVGHLLMLLPEVREAITFENLAATDYEVAIHYAEIPEGVLTNPRTTRPEYHTYKEWIGARAHPNSVVYAGGVLTLEVDSVLEAGVDSSGRTIVVWLDDPQTSIEADAIESVASYWDAPDNKVDLSGLLGQLTTAVSTDPDDYWVASVGPAVWKNATLKGLPEFVFVGTVTGGGAGNPPSAKDISEQYTYPDFTSVFDDVIEVSVEGQKKIRVTAYDVEPLDRRQISVRRETSGEFSFLVDKEGNIDAGLDSVGATEIPSFTLHRNGTDFQIAWDSGNGRLKIGINGEDVELDFTKILIASVLEALGGALTFDDTNITTPIPLSGPTTPERILDSVGPQTIIGAINVAAEHSKALDWGLRSAILEGAATSPAGANVSISEAYYLIDGRFYFVDSSAVAVSTDSYLYFRASDRTYQLAASLPLPSVDDVLIAYVDTTGGVPVSTTNLKRYMRQVNDRTDIIVGTKDGTVPISGVHFRTVGEAVAAIRDGFGPNDLRQWRIVVLGQTLETSTPIVLPTGLEILGVRGATVKWGTNNPLFDMSGSFGVALRGFNVDYSDAGALPSGSQTRVILANATGNTNNLTVRDVHFVGTNRIHGLCNFTNTVENSNFRKFYAYANCADYGMRFGEVIRTRIVSARLQRDGTASGGTWRDGLYVADGENLWFDSLEIDGWVGRGADLNFGASHFSNSTISNTAEAGLRLVGGNTRSTFIGLIVDGVAHTPTGTAAAVVLLSSASYHMVIGCGIRPGGATTTAVNVTNAACTDNTFVGNNFNGFTFTDTGTNTYWKTTPATGYNLNNP